MVSSDSDTGPCCCQWLDGFEWCRSLVTNWFQGWNASHGTRRQWANRLRLLVAAPMTPVLFCWWRSWRRCGDARVPRHFALHDALDSWHNRHVTFTVICWLFGRFWLVTASYRSRGVMFRCRLLVGGLFSRAHSKHGNDGGYRWGLQRHVINSGTIIVDSGFIVVIFLFFLTLHHQYSVMVVVVRTGRSSWSTFSCLCWRCCVVAFHSRKADERNDRLQIGSVCKKRKFWENVISFEKRKLYKFMASNRFNDLQLKRVCCQVKSIKGLEILNSRVSLVIIKFLRFSNCLCEAVIIKSRSGLISWYSHKAFKAISLWLLVIVLNFFHFVLAAA